MNYENSGYILDKCPTSGVGNSNRAGMAAWRNNLMPETLRGMFSENQNNNGSNSNGINGCLLICLFFLSLIYKHYIILLKLKVNILKTF